MAKYRRPPYSVIGGNLKWFEEFDGDPETLIDWELLRRPPIVMCDKCRTTERCPTKSSLPEGWSGGYYGKNHYCPKCAA